MTKRKRRLGLLILLSLIALYFIGPQVDKPVFSQELPVIRMNLTEMEDSLNQSEAYTTNLKPDNQARIVWADTLKKEKTEVAIVYLHGFTASQEEGNPVHRKFAKKFGCNMYMARLNYHGRGGENQLQFMTPEGLYEDAKRAIAIGKTLGNEVIVMSTSTGGTLAIYYASQYDDLKAIINYSPNVRIKQKASYLLNKPWGFQLARFVYGGKYKIDECNDYDEKYWNCKTRLEAIIELQVLVDNTMTEEIFNKVTTPSFTGYYYKDKKDQDPTVSTKAIEWMNQNIATPENKKRLIAFPDAETHVIANGVKSKAWRQVLTETEKYAIDVLGMVPVDTLHR
jgi:esterase/lipase